MAEQKGILPLKGNIGNINFFKTKDGYMARTKGGVAGSKIKTDPAFARTRENMAEFQRAGKAGRLLRIALKDSLDKVRDGKMSNRMTREMMKVIHADAVSMRGERNVIDGEAGLLQHFEFNQHAHLATNFFAHYAASIDRATGAVSIDIPSFAPASKVLAPNGTSHFQLFMCAAAIDFEAETHSEVSDVSGFLPYDLMPTAAIALTASLAANSTHPLFLAFGIEFHQEVNGNKYNLNNGAFNSCALVKVDTPV